MNSATEAQSDTQTVQSAAVSQITELRSAAGAESRVLSSRLAARSMDGHDAWADVQTASTSRLVNGNGPLSPAASVSIEAQRPSLYRLTSETRRSVEGLNDGKGKQRATDVRRSLDELSRSSAAARPEDLLGRLAIVHELSKTDTLAGISLQYGISVCWLSMCSDARRSRHSVKLTD